MYMYGKPDEATEVVEAELCIYGDEPPSNHLHGEKEMEEMVHT